jgi:flagellar protein FliS
MDTATREQYLASQIFTATPERLHLMLIDGAIRFAGQLCDALHAGDAESATNFGERCRNVLSEMLLGVNRDGNDAAKRLRSIYSFLIRDVTDAQLRRQADRMNGVLRVLSIERDTWAQACERAGESDFRRDEPHSPAAHVPAPMPSLEPPAMPSESFSFRA